MVNGVAQVNINGSQKAAVRVDVDPHKLAAHGIGIDEVATAITNANVNLPTGTMYGDERNFVVKANGQLLQASAYGPVIIAYRNGNPVRLNEVAHVYDGVENDQIAGWFKGERAITLAINKQPGTNVVQVVDDVKALLPTLQRAAAGGLSLQIRADRSLLIRESVHDVKLTLLAHGLPRRPGDLPVPAERVGDHHSEPRDPGLDRRDLRGDVPARLQPRQPVADGADALGRLRRRQHDRDAREHRAAHGDGQVAACARRTTARRKSRSRFWR